MTTTEALGLGLSIFGGLCAVLAGVHVFQREIGDRTSRPNSQSTWCAVVLFFTVTPPPLRSFDDWTEFF